MYGSLGQLDDAQIAAASETLVDLYQVRELISQQDALITGVLAAGRMTGDEYARFAQLVGAQRYQTAEAVAELSPADRIRYDQLAGSDAVARFRVLEDRVIQQSRLGDHPAVDRRGVAVDHRPGDAGAGGIRGERRRRAHRPGHPGRDRVSSGWCSPAVSA